MRIMHLQCFADPVTASHGMFLSSLCCQCSAVLYRATKTKSAPQGAAYLPQMAPNNIKRPLDHGEFDSAQQNAAADMKNNFEKILRLDISDLLVAFIELGVSTGPSSSCLVALIECCVSERLSWSWTPVFFCWHVRRHYRLNFGHHRPHMHPIYQNHNPVPKKMLKTITILFI